MNESRLFHTPPKTVNGMHDSTSNETKTLPNSSPTSSDTMNLAYCDTSLLEDPRSEPDPFKTITKSVTSMSLQSSTTELVNGQSCNIGVSRLVRHCFCLWHSLRADVPLQETVIILFRGTEICLSPDGAITISRHSPRLMLPSVLYMKWGRSQRTKRPLDKASSNAAKKRKNEKSTTF